MLTPFRNRHLVLAYLLALAGAFVLGCSAKDDPAEELIVCGNHTCGELTMVTTDTNGPGGYRYLDGDISPDGSRVAFTADWSVIPTIPEDEIEIPELSRQILIMPLPMDAFNDTMNYRDPVTSIADLGAELVHVGQFYSQIGGGLDPVEGPTAGSMTKGSPNWLDHSTLIFSARFERRDRLVRADVSVPAQTEVTPIFYEEDDLRTSGGRIWYHRDPKLSPDKRWCLFVRFGCDDESNAEDANCGDQELWVLDMSTTEDPTQAVAMQLTSGAVVMEDPAWSPDGRTISFAASTDLVGDDVAFISELFTLAFDPVAAATGAVELDSNMRRITTTDVAAGDPIVGLTNTSPAFTPDGADIVFVSSRRAPGVTQRGRNLWIVPVDGRLEPELLFFSRYDEGDPTFDLSSGTLLFSSRMGFPTEMLDALQRETFEFLTNVYNDTARIPLTEAEIEQRVEDERDELKLFENKMSHLFLYQGF